MTEPYYEQDGITIYHGDCREILPGLAADVLVTDPPYGTGERLRREGKFADTRQSWDEWSMDWLPEMSAGAVFCPPRRIPDMAEVAGPLWRLLAWVSPNPAARKGVAPRTGVQPIVAWGASNISSLDWFRYRGNQSTEHPHEKPLPVMAWIVGMFSGTVLDPFMGSGTTLCAAKDLGRKAIGIEMEERYCEMAARRLAQGVLPFARSPQ